MAARRFLMNAGRTSKQGQQINVGKDHAEYQTIVNTLIMHPDDMKALNVAAGSSLRVWTEYGEATFQCKEGNVPAGMIFVPYGPPTCRLMGGGTDGTGMPTSKGWEVDVEPIAAPPAASSATCGLAERAASEREAASGKDIREIDPKE
jgi:formylmethanofuran dehydrogenase subunit D